MNKETGEETITTLVINQTYSSIGVGHQFKLKKVGRSLYFLSSIIFKMTRKKDLNKSKAVISLNMVYSHAPE